MTIFENYDEIVCIGGCCEPSFIISYFKHTNNTFPFDWCLVKNIDSVTDVISNNFIDFDQLNIDTEDLYIDQKMLRVGNKDIYIAHYNDKTAIEYSIKVNNFKNLLITNKKILFLWKSHIYRNPKPEEFTRFINILNKLYPQLIYDILVVNEYDDLEDINDDYPDKCIVKNIVDIKSNIVQDKKDKCLHECEVSRCTFIYDIWEKNIINY